MAKIPELKGFTLKKEDPGRFRRVFFD